jgi:hypothetical protein
MMPLYSFQAAFCLIDATGKLPGIFKVIRDFYEAVVILTFVQLIFIVLPPKTIAQEFRKKMQKPETPFAANIPTPFRTPGVRYVYSVMLGVFQFCIVMACVTLFGIILWEYYGITENALQMIPEALKSVSIGWAMYCLTVFYFEIQRNEELRERFENLGNAEGKFMCIKGIIMFTIMQSFATKFLAKVHAFDHLTLTGPPLEPGQPPQTLKDAQQVATAILNFALCLEMLPFALLHVWAYPVHEFSNTTIPEPDWIVGIRGLWAQMRELRLEAYKQRLVINRLRKGDMTEAEIDETFKAFDLSKTGYISIAECKYMLEAANFNEEIIERILKRADGDGDGQITPSEFQSAFINKGVDSSGFFTSMPASGGKLTQALLCA